MNYNEFNSPATKCLRRREESLAYAVNYKYESDTYWVRIFSIRNNRSPSILGALKMKTSEWHKFHDTVYLIWDKLQWNGDDEIKGDDEIEEVI